MLPIGTHPIPARCTVSTGQINKNKSNIVDAEKIVLLF